jgi:hypothetical protein
MKLLEKAQVVEIVKVKTLANGFPLYAFLALGQLGRDVPPEKLFLDMDDEIQPSEKNSSFAILGTAVYRIPLQKRCEVELSYSSHYFPKDEVEAFFDEVFRNPKVMS